MRLLISKQEWCNKMMWGQYERMREIVLHARQDKLVGSFFKRHGKSYIMKRFLKNIIFALLYTCCGRARPSMNRHSLNDYWCKCSKLIFSCCQPGIGSPMMDRHHGENDAVINQCYLWSSRSSCTPMHIRFPNCHLEWLFSLDDTSIHIIIRPLTTWPFKSPTK